MTNTDTTDTIATARRAAEAVDAEVIDYQCDRDKGVDIITPIIQRETHLRETKERFIAAAETIAGLTGCVEGLALVYPEIGRATQSRIAKAADELEAIRDLLHILTDKETSDE